MADTTETADEFRQGLIDAGLLHIADMERRQRLALYRLDSGLAYLAEVIGRIEIHCGFQGGGTGRHQGEYKDGENSL